MMTKETKQRASAQRESVVKALAIAGRRGVSNGELQRISLNYTARVAELRKAGYVIDCQDGGEGTFYYILKEVPVQETEQQRAIELFFDIVKNEYGDIVDSEALKQILASHRFNVVRNWGANTGFVENRDKVLA
jgi:hypothetical protein